MPQLDWNAAINSLRESLPHAQFVNWFEPLRLIRCDETSVVVGVPNRFHGEWMRSNYVRCLTQAIRKQCGEELQLEFEVSVQEENVVAARSVVLTPAPSSARPNLRLIDTEENEIVDEGKAAQLGDALSERPNLPAFLHHFIELESNRFARQVSELFAQGDPRTNPLIIIAGVGMGKTHILSEIGSSISARDHAVRVRYTQSESFTGEMVQHFKRGDIFSFKRKYRDETDCLLFDDIQALAGKRGAQEQLVHIFNGLIERGGRIAFTTSVSPSRLEEFIEPLKSRLLSSVIGEVKFPCFKERVQLLSGICEQHRIVVDGMVLRSLADKGQKDIRELIGNALRLHLQARLENRELDESFLSRDVWATEEKTDSTTMEDVIVLVEHNFGVTRTELMSKSRKSLTTWARQVAMYLARHYTLMPLEEIGKTFGRDHATVIHAFQKVTETMQAHRTRRYEVEFLKQKLESRLPRGNHVVV